MDEPNNRKHQLFAQKIACGMSSAEAYLSVYPDVKKSTAKANGHKLERKLADYIQSLTQTEHKKDTYNREYLINRALQICQEERDPRSVIQALDFLAKIGGYYAPEKNVNINMDLNFLSPDGSGA